MRGSAVSVNNVVLTYPETGVVLKGITFGIRRGELVHVLGQNGAGKSSLLRTLAGLERPDSGTVELAGIGAPRPEKLPGRVGVLFQNPARQLFCESVKEEVAFTLKRMGMSAPEVVTKVARVLTLCNAAHLADRAPLTLSYGEQHRVALAAALAPQPTLLLLDEPFAGLDLPQRFAFLEILHELAQSFGTAVLIASHDELPDPAWPDRCFRMEEGVLEEVPR